MTTSDLEPLIAQGMSTREIAKELGCSQCNVRYWLKKLDLETRRGGRGKLVYLCSICGEHDPSKFYHKRKRRCKSCDDKRVVELSRETKRKVVEYLGGQCLDCGFSKANCALDVHHLDPSTKDPNFNNLLLWKWSRVEKELQKCVLLCRNCHAIRHYYTGA